MGDELYGGRYKVIIWLSGNLVKIYADNKMVLR